LQISEIRKEKWILDKHCFVTPFEGVVWWGGLTFENTKKHADVCETKYMVTDT
jgi:hypothetical protein